MASIQKTSQGWRAQIKKKGVRDSRLFATRREAVAWAAEREEQIMDAATKPASEQHTLRDALRKYADEVSPTKRGERWEQIRLAAFESYRLPLDEAIGRVTSQHVADFRDSRGASVGPASVIREMTLLSSVFETARIEWGWVDVNPCRGIRKPQQPRHRDRTLTWREIRAMLRIMGYRRGRVSSTGQAVAVCMLTALATGMRAGELCGLTWDRVHDKHVRLDITKNGRPRDVPLSRKACRYIEQMRGWDDDLVFGLKTASLDALFRKYRARAGLDGFTWHDTRHTAATMLSCRVDVLTLCKIFGWANTSQALTYYNPKASTIADMLG
ncbi:site-specific integrase [Castellaniella sp.]|uniref:tyrosine-type recombinase/integrase n=1 Tax=Castellaniella sp. TaxID=1955812 RepID=UPI002AFEADE3|nr:site-specific integrase [Castellaniella sp.]